MLFRSNRAIREGDWKLVAKGPAAPWELYNLANDRTELHDLAAAEPERAKDLAAKWDAWAKRANVLPWPWDAPSQRQIPQAARLKK